MIHYTTGDLLSDPAEALVNTVNCVGVMGRGIALQFKKQFPDNFIAYEQACKAGQVQLGKMFVWENQTIFDKSYIINFPTKNHWRGKSELADIANGLDDLVRVINKHQIKSIAIPPLGSGLGGLDWNDVKPLIEQKLAGLSDTKIIVYEPSNIAQSKRIANKSTLDITPGRAALIGLMQRYLDGLLDPYISLLEVHKLMYFLQESGEPLRLNYTKNIYGPYAENLRHVLNQLEGHYIEGYYDGGDEPNKPLKLIGDANKQAIDFLQHKPTTLQNLQRVAELVDGFETSTGMELLSTVYWLAKDNADATVSELVKQTHAWSERKQNFSARQIEIAHTALLEKGWLDRHENSLSVH